MKHVRPRLRCFALAATSFPVLFVSGCTDEPPVPIVIERLDEQVLRDIDRRRVRVRTDDIERLEAVFHLDAPKNWSFRMRTSIGLAAFGHPDCTILIADNSDKAIHWFGGPDAAYQRSVYLGGRDTALVNRLSKFAAATPHLMAVADRGRRTLLRLSEEGDVVSVTEIPQLEPGGELVPLARIALGRDGTLFEQPSWSSAQLVQSPGLVRVWEEDGQFRLYLGEVVPAEQPLFTEFLSLGEFVIRGDTLWMARASDGRILGYDVSAAESPAIASYDLPLFFEMDPPAIILLDSVTQETSITARRHVDNFAIDPRGNFFVEQYREDGRPVLGALFREDGISYRAFDLQVESIRALAATEDYLFAVVVLPGDGPGTRVLGFRNPFSVDAAAPVSCR